MKKLLYISFLLLIILQACYEEYKFNYENTAVYFSQQNPLRTLVVDEGEELNLEVGVMLGGKYLNEKEEKVNFEIDPAMLDMYPALKMLPESYYSISSNSEMVIPAGEFLGKVTITLNDSFLEDDSAHFTHYAIPFRIIGTTADSILFDKDSTIVAIKYQNQYFGEYWIKGTDQTLDEAGGVVSEFVYANDELVSNSNKRITTLSKNSCLIPYCGADLTGDNALKITIDGSSVTIEAAEGNVSITDISGTGTYDSTEGIFSLVYTYVSGTETHHVVDKLYHFHTPLNFETWQ